MPERLPVLPLRDLVFFPQHVMPLLVGRPASLAALEAAASTPDQLLLLVAQRDGEEAEPTAAGLHRVGVVARVLQLTPLPNGVAKVLLEGVARARVTRFTPSGPLLRATLVRAPLASGTAPSPLSPADQATARRAVALFEEYAALHRRVPSEVVQLVVGVDLPERQAYTMAAHLAVRQAQRQELLECADLMALFAALAGVLQGEIELLRLERKIEEDVRGTLFKHQREYFLQEQLRAIHRELGQEEDESAELEAQIAARGLPPAAEARARRELRRLRKLSAMSPEAGVARSYLEWLLALPWHEREEGATDPSLGSGQALAAARAVLDQEHHGLEQVKERILDYVAVLGGQEGGRGPLPLLCLVGPPGVGKTSLGRSIAHAVGRRFARMSLGGMRDEAEIRGHRRTYVGAMPGRILQSMRRVGVVNPVLLLDEIDKLGQDYRGDPAAALLEVLDPEQQHAFSDHYLELDYDLSQVLFLTTANSLAGIPAPLRDRMEVIRLPGYLDQEKRAIAQRHLLPRQLERHGFGGQDVVLEADALGAVMRGYTREAGVRELDRRLARLVRKLARRRAEAGSEAGTEAGTASGGGGDGPIVVRVEDVRPLLGPAPFDGEHTTLDDKVGVASGLAFTPAGGEVLEIEVSAVPGRGRLQLTGTLGDVMKESAGAALSFARARAGALGLPADFHRTRDLHLHIPAGATPKDGPSAGVAITTAIVSALTGIPVRGDVAMTGEITLRGRVLPIGGLREKAVAALRNGITQVVIPAGNVRQLEELPDEVREQLTFHAVETLDAALALALRDAPVAAPAPPPAPATGVEA